MTSYKSVSVLILLNLPWPLMQSPVMALEVNVSAIHYLQDKQKLQLKGTALNMNVHRGMSDSVLIV